MTERDNQAHESLPISLLIASPNGFVRCASDWLAQAKGGRGFDSSSEGFAAAGKAMMAAPEIFVGLSLNDWTEGPYPSFWLSFFQASASGTPVVDFTSFLKKLDKPALAIGARNMLMIAAKAKDVESFRLLLSMEAARRSKLVMFAAYQHGGKAIAEIVKQPTALEALELLRIGGATWSRQGRVQHDLEGLEWLVDKCSPGIDPFIFAAIASATSDQDVLENGLSRALPKLECKDQVNSYGTVMLAKEKRALQAVIAMAMGGSPWFAKQYAVSIGGAAYWKRLCQGEALNCSEIQVRARDGKSSEPIEASLYVRLQGAVGIQAACAFSRHEPACSWLFKEVKAAGGEWVGAARLKAQLDSGFLVNNGRGGLDAHIFAASISASERAEFTEFMDCNSTASGNSVSEGGSPAPSQAPRSKNRL